ncbi:hypothetical protein REPUB_Repub04eG0094400 [Reevesia pubescens]
MKQGCIASKSVWGARNGEVKEQIKQSIDNVVLFAAKYVDECESLQAVDIADTVRRATRDDVWNPPQSSFIKINFDGAIDKAIGHGGIGAIIRDTDGFMLAACSLFQPGISDPSIIEAVVAIYEIKFARSLGFQSVLLEGDALNVINLLKKEESNFSYIDNLIHEGRIRLRALKYFEVAHVRRNANKATFLLAKHERETK